jgi:2,3-bisphosphoglycerate-dependent phosphoglycerate mutase
MPTRNDTPIRVSQGWPQRLWLLRHGESAGNVARDEADAAGLSRIELGGRDVDVPLSERGEEQSLAIGHWFGGMPEAERPQIILSSPYLRARRTAEIIQRAAGFGAGSATCILDERLREKEFGMLDGLTKVGIKELFPAEFERRQVVGKFYYRPPGGESWCDVILRMRNTLHSLSLHYAGCRVLIVTHQVVVLCLRYLVEEMDEAQVLEIDRTADVVNCGITEYHHEPAGSSSEGRLALKRYNFTVPLRREGAPVTDAPDVSAAPR